MRRNKPAEIVNAQIQNTAFPRSLLDLVEQKRFRLDLFYRLNGVEVEVPPLRCRRDDILELARYFLVRIPRIVISWSAAS